MSFRARLTLAAAAAVALAVAAACAIAYLVVDSRLHAEVDASIRTRVALFQRLVAQTPRGTIRGHQQAFAGSDVYTQFVTTTGQVRRLEDEQGPFLPVDAAAAHAVGRHVPLRLRDVTVRGVHLRVGTASLPNGWALQVARRLTETDSVLARIRTVFVVVAAAGIALAALLGAFVAQAALRPVRRLTEASEEVARTRDLSRRIEVSGGDELSRLARSFNTMMAALEQSVAAQRQLVADASHELRTPLTSLRTNFEVLMRRDGLAGESRDRLVRDVQQQFQEMTTLVADVVELARDEQTPAEEDDVRLDLLVAEAVERARRNAPQVRYTLTGEPVLVRGVAARIDRAVSNLLDNAAKWSPEGGGVEVDVAAGVVTVRDHGPGIAEEDLPYIFDRFYRSREARSMSGSGLGLAIVRQVAEAHGGRVEVERPSRGGSAFRLVLPPVAAVPDEAPP